MRNYKYFFTILIVLFFAVNSTAQEVFFKDNTTRLKAIAPSYYYPFKNGSRFQEFITKNTANNMRLLGSATEISAPDRFTNNGEALGMNGNSGYISPPDVIFNEMINNKVVNMSFWVKYTDEVYNGTKEGVILKIAPKATGSSSKLYVAIKEGKFIMYAMRPKVTGGEVLVPVIKVDFPLDWGNEKMGSDTNGFIYISINAIGKDVKKTLISFGRPGGRLYCRSYYMYPFENINTQNDTLLMFGGKLGGDQVKADRIDDIMFFTKNDYTNRILTPEEVLNNFYLQSPLYEGVSYQMQTSRSTLILGSNHHAGDDLKEEWLAFWVSPASFSPFSYSCFKVIQKADNKSFYKFSSMKMGGEFARSTNNYIYMSTSGSNEYYKYIRDVSDPTSMYSLSVQNFSLQDEGKRGLLQSYFSEGKSWLVFDSPPSDKSKSLFNISAAIKVFRGSERMWEGKIGLRLHGKNFQIGRRARYNSAPRWDYVNFTNSHQDFVMKNSYHGAYIKSTFSSVWGERNFRRYNGASDMSEGSYFISSNESPTNFEFIYVKEDVNGKPLYMMTTSDDNAMFKLGRGDSIKQVYKNALNVDGTVPDDLLWSLERAD
ncbi:hypothetical protein [Chryseobacterium sp.]|uniref:hypothetical protein n=1 Tax=Chryseobacterium sp. TaxID=1871047 RepID=UPI002899FF01|nr:hypothetical protein [Chryseobacterium sp.]